MPSTSATARRPLSACAGGTSGREHFHGSGLSTKSWCDVPMSLTMPLLLQGIEGEFRPPAARIGLLRGVRVLDEYLSLSLSLPGVRSLSRAHV